jgi:peptidyl-prolyl cis-trans isomerase B (cyclophilin B)
LVRAQQPAAQEQAEAEPEEANPQVVLKTAKGEMVLELFSQHAPQAVDLFLKYAREGRYNRLPFERYAEDFAIQLAAPKIEERISLPDERNNGLKHVQGTAGLSWDLNRRSSGNKLYFCLATVPQLNNKHTVIGQVTEGLDVLLQLRPGDRLEKVTVRTLPHPKSETAPKAK